MVQRFAIAGFCLAYLLATLPVICLCTATAACASIAATSESSPFVSACCRHVADSDTTAEPVPTRPIAPCVCAPDVEVEAVPVIASSTLVLQSRFRFAKPTGEISRVATSPMRQSIPQSELCVWRC